MNSLLSRGIKELGLSCSLEQMGQLEAFLAEIMLFNPSYRLVSNTDENEIVVSHILDTAAGVPYFLREEKKTDIIDLGSGAGFPAIVLSIFMPESRIVLCERMKRRVDFLNSTIARLRLKNAEVRFEGAESIKDTFDIVTSRAFHTLTDSYPLMKPLLREDGKIILYKGMKSKCLEEIKDLERLGHSVTYSIESISVPYLNRERSLLYIK